MEIIILWIVISVVLVSVFMWLYICRYFQQRYFERNYHPQWLKEDEIGNFPKNYEIKNIPWISYKKAYCQPATIQMVAYKNGIKADRDYINFLMGHTYGAVYFGKQLSIMPTTDPEAGAEVAAPYLGLKRNYLVTNDLKLFIKAVKFYLSKDYPIRIALNVAILSGKLGFSPHSELLIGYNDEYFFYFETGNEDRWSENKRRLSIDEQTLTKAVNSLSKTFNLPWKFQLTTYEKYKKEKDLRKIWKRNGELLVGNKWGPVKSGSFAIRKFSSDLEKLSSKITDWQSIEYLLEWFSYTRFDNVKFLKEHFMGNKKVEEASQNIEKAAKCYEESLKILKKDKKINEIITLLYKAASLEKKAGEVFISKDKELDEGISDTT